MGVSDPARQVRFGIKKGRQHYQFFSYCKLNSNSRDSENIKITLEIQNLLPTHDRHVIRNPTVVRHTRSLAFAGGGWGFPEFDFLEVGVTVCGTTFFAK